jgi:hypothetical protein
MAFSGRKQRNSAASDGGSYNDGGYMIRLKVED